MALWNTFLTERSLLFQPLGYLSALPRLPSCVGCLATRGWSNQTVASSFPSSDREMIYWWNWRPGKPSPSKKWIRSLSYKPEFIETTSEVVVVVVGINKKKYISSGVVANIYFLKNNDFTPFPKEYDYPAEHWYWQVRVSLGTCDYIWFLSPTGSDPKTQSDPQAIPDVASNSKPTNCGGL